MPQTRGLCFVLISKSEGGVAQLQTSSRYRGRNNRECLTPDGDVAAIYNTGSPIRQGQPQGDRGTTRMDSIFKLQEVRGILPCTHSGVGVAGPVSRCGSSFEKQMKGFKQLDDLKQKVQRKSKMYNSQLGLSAQYRVPLRKSEKP